MYDNPAGFFYFGLPYLLAGTVFGLLYAVDPLLPPLLYALMWGVLVGVSLGLGVHLRWVALHVLALLLMLGIIGYKAAGGAGALLGIIQFANLLDSALMVAIVTGFIAWKGKRAIGNSEAGSV